MTKDQARAKALDLLRRVNTLNDFMQVIKIDLGNAVVVIGEHRFLIQEFIARNEIPNIQMTGGNCFIFTDKTSCIVKRHGVMAALSPRRTR